MNVSKTVCDVLKNENHFLCASALLKRLLGVQSGNQPTNFSKPIHHRERGPPTCTPPKTIQNLKGSNQPLSNNSDSHQIGVCPVGVKSMIGAQHGGSQTVARATGLGTGAGADQGSQRVQQWGVVLRGAPPTPHLRALGHHRVKLPGGRASPRHKSGVFMHVQMSCMKTEKNTQIEKKQLGAL